MPVVSAFYGILVLFYFDDYNPPHFHVKYGEYEALIDIETFGIYKGNLPKKAYSLIVEWAFEHKEELIKNWELTKSNQTPNKIEPLN